MSTVNIKEARTGIHPCRTYAITISSLQCEVIGRNVASHEVIVLYVNEIFTSGSLPTLLKLYTQEDFNIYIRPQIKP